MRRVIHKVFAYVTIHQHLLVFHHPYAPEAGIQVPAGTVEANEQFAETALREVFEETGLRDLTLHGFLGEQERDMIPNPDDYSMHITSNRLEKLICSYTKTQ